MRNPHSRVLLIGHCCPQKFWKSHWCVPFTATFSKRRKIGALWNERCDESKGLQSLLADVVRSAKLFSCSHALRKTPDLSLLLLLCPFNEASKRLYHCHCLSLPLPLLLRDACAPCDLRISRGKIVTPKGVLLLALCHASATREGPWASSRELLPAEKLMWHASLQLETYQLSHW